MSSLLRTKGVQIGQDNTATNNFTLYQPGVPDGTLRIGNGNSGSTTDAITINSSGNVGIGTSSPSQPFQVEKNFNGSTWAYINNSTAGTGAGSGILLGTDTNGAASAIFQNSSLNTDKAANALRIRNLLSAPIVFEVNATERMRVDSAGRVTKPNTPKFLAYFTSASDFDIGGIYIFNATKFNQGNHYSTSTGTFTAPVTGLYNFTWNLFLTSSAGATQLMAQAPYINGSYYSGSDAYQTQAIPNGCGGNIVQNGSFNIQLNANDNFQLAVRGATNRVYRGHCWLGGYLIG